MKRLSLSNMSLQAKISLPVLAGLVIGLGLFSWLGLQAVDTTTDRILEERLDRARIAADLLDDNLSHLELHLVTAADMVSDINSRTEFDAMAGSVERILRDADMSPLNIMVADKTGKVIQTRYGAPVIDFSRHPELVKMLQSGTPSVSNAVVDDAGEQVVLAASPIIKASGATGMVAVVVDVSDFGARSFQAMRIGDTGYAEVVDSNGVVLIRTQPALRPRTAERSDHPQRFAQLISEGKAAVRTCHRCHEEQTSLPRQRDVLAFAPLTMASWGVALRQSEEEALAPTTQLERRLLLLGAIVLFAISLLVWLIMQSVIRPIRMLTAATQRVAAGDFKTNVPRRRRDEIGRLSAAFHTMTDELQRSREDLLSRNRELLVLNSVATTVSQSLDQDLILENALERVLEVSHAASGCVFLAGRDSGSLGIKALVGRPGLYDCGAPSGANCACYQVMRSGQTMAVNHPSQCPLLENSQDEKYPGSFIAVPLKSRARTLGTMNVGCPGQERFTDNDFKLLESIGYYVGLAIENATLYEDARQKEELRGQLLTRVISAQEEERKRISRELHDEHGQILTGLIINMDKMESMILPQQTQLMERMGKARGLLSRLLDNLRSLTVGLRPPDLDDLGLIAAITGHAEERLGAAGIVFKCDADDFERDLPPAMETALFRIVQEAINNIIRHAGAKSVFLQFALEQGKVKVIIEDNGQGFEPDLNSRRQEGSLGLLGIRERTELLGGTFKIYSRKGWGTRLTVEIPVPEAVPAGKQSA
ncbi:MAG: HAMP domain-containing protein [Dehalococcoidales bacterium]|nr:HAMP domain-containing protein [Dehalococcoidales bacterium]